MWAYVIGHWRGEHSLARSYWVNGVLLGLPFNAMSSVLEIMPPPKMDLALYTFLTIIDLVLIMAWVAWFAIGTWRSASSHVRFTGRRFWARVAQFLVVLNLLFMPLAIYGGGVSIWNLGLAVLGRDGFTPATLRIDENGVLVLEGHLMFETPAAFEQVLADNGAITMVQLESLGGYLEPAKMMAEMIEERGLETYTSIECASACTDLFIAGRTRYLDFDGVLGFHSVSVGGIPDVVISALDTDFTHFFLDQGVPQSFLDKANAVPSSEIWVPTLLELVEANIVTHIYDYEEDATYTASEFCAAYDCAVLPYGADSEEEAETGPADAADPADPVE